MCDFSSVDKALMRTCTS